MAKDKPYKSFSKDIM